MVLLFCPLVSHDIHNQEFDKDYNPGDIVYIAFSKLLCLQ